MDLSKFYICVCLVVAIEAISIPQYAYRQVALVEDKAEALQKKEPIPILQQSFEQSKDGYQFSYDTGNGIHAEESGYIKNKGDEKNEVVVQQGTITYHDENGKPISLTYIADEKGFRPQGAHLPTPPPIPEEILKSLEQNAHEEQQEQHEQQPEKQYEQQYEQQEEQHIEQEHQVQVIPSAQKEAQEEYQYQQPEQEVEYEAPQLTQKEYESLIQEQIQKQLREQPQQQYHPQQEYRIQYHQAGY